LRSEFKHIPKFLINGMVGCDFALDLLRLNGHGLCPAAMQRSPPETVVFIVIVVA
jgi:hypothetical protein